MSKEATDILEVTKVAIKAVSTTTAVTIVGTGIGATAAIAARCTGTGKEARETRQHGHDQRGL
jgi:hypothetical protein